jgi:hypothetical protein
VIVFITLVLVDCVAVTVEYWLRRPTPSPIPSAIAQIIITAIITNAAIKQRIKIPWVLRSAGCLGELITGRLEELVIIRLEELIAGRLG